MAQGKHKGQENSTKLRKKSDGKLQKHVQDWTIITENVKKKDEKCKINIKKIREQWQEQTGQIKSILCQNLTK